MPNEAFALEVRSLGVTIGRNEILKDIAFSVPRGQICAVLGANGSGKTTLLRCAAGLRSASGSVTVCGTERRKDPRAYATAIGYASSEPVIPAELTAEETVLAGFYPELGLLGRLTETQKERAREVLCALGIGETADKLMKTLSGGQKRLVTIARAMVRAPGLLILDEPDAALDPPHRRALMEGLRKAAEETRCAVLLSSHDANGMLRRADRLLLLREGRLVSDLLCRESGTETLREGLSLLYGPVELLRRGDTLLMTEE